MIVFDWLSEMIDWYSNAVLQTDIILCFLSSGKSLIRYCWLGVYVGISFLKGKTNLACRTVFRSMWECFLVNDFQLWMLIFLFKPLFQYFQKKVLFKYQFDNYLGYKSLKTKSIRMSSGDKLRHFKTTYRLIGAVFQEYIEKFESYLWRLHRKKNLPNGFSLQLYRCPFSC